MARRQGEGAGGGVAHAPGLPGATPLREIPSPELTCGDGSIRSGGKATRMGNAAEQGMRVLPAGKWPGGGGGGGGGGLVDRAGVVSDAEQAEIGVWPVALAAALRLP